VEDAAFVARILTGTLFLVAAVAKSRSRAGFVRSVWAVLELLGIRAGRAIRRLVAVLVIAYELVLAGLLLFGAAPTAAAAAGLVLVAVFALVSALALLRGRKIECNCFGRSETALGRDTLVRAAMLAAALVVYAVAARGTWPEGLSEWVSSLALVVGCGLVFVWTVRLSTLVTFVRERRLVESRVTRRRVERSRPLQRLRSI
jgi:Methylamine utilisation protein MauE